MKRIFIDPSYPIYENNKLFDANDKFLNRDDTLAPYIKLKKDLSEKSIELLTYDLVKNFSKEELKGDGYISFGNLRSEEELLSCGLKLLAFSLMEPPLVTTKMYEKLPFLTKNFEKVFVHNTHGEGYSLKNVDRSKLHQLYWTQPYGDVIDEHWSNLKRDKKIIVINGNHKPKRMLNKELYSHRIRWSVDLSEYIGVDFYGRGWDKILSRASLWLVFLKNYYKIQKIYRGTCGSKLPLMAKYDFALCLENLEMDGYITEKVFDCFYSGAIPIYQGGKDIVTRIPAECFIDLRSFKNAKDLAGYLLNLSEEKKQAYRLAGKAFMKGPEGQKFYQLIDVLGVA